MILEFGGIVGRGRIDEGLVFNVLEDGNIDNYCLYYQPKDLAFINLVYMFRDHEVKKFDTVVLYTMSGVNGKKKENQIELHKFYQNLEQPIWHSADDRAFLIEKSDFD